MTASSSGDGVWPTRGAEASGLKCGRKRAADRGEDGEEEGVQEQGVATQREGGGSAFLSTSLSKEVDTSSCNIHTSVHHVHGICKRGKHKKNDNLLARVLLYTLSGVTTTVSLRQDEKAMTVTTEQTLPFHGAFSIFT